jgi:hypothetical protein
VAARGERAAAGDAGGFDPPPGGPSLPPRGVSHHDRPAGDVQDDAGDPRRLIASEIERSVGDVLGGSETPDRMQFDEILLLSAPRYDSCRAS